MVVKKAFKRSRCMLIIYILCTFATFIHAETTPNYPSSVAIGVIENSKVHEQIVPILLNAYAKAGVDVNIRRLPAARVLLDANRRILDGDAARTKAIENKFANLIRIPTPVFTIKSVSYSLLPDIPPFRSWNDLRHYRIGIVRGIVYARNATKGFSVLTANNHEHLFHLLLANRIDVAISTVTDGSNIIDEVFPNRRIRQGEEILHEEQLFHYIHKDHKALIPILNDAFQNIQ